MTFKKSLWILGLVGLSTAAYAQQSKAASPVRIRAVLHDPIHPTADLYCTDDKGAVVKVEFRPKDLSNPLLTIPVNGALVLYDKANVDPQKPEASLAATCTIPPNSKRGVVVVLPSPAGFKPAYRMVFIDDSAKAFPKGESRILTLLPVEAAIEAGEHKIPIRPGVIANLPPVKKVDDYNMAQTNFYYKQAESWTVFSERQLQYLNGVRYLFIIYSMPGALQPTVGTIVDTTVPQ